MESWREPWGAPVETQDVDEAVDRTRTTLVLRPPAVPVSWRLSHAERSALGAWVVTRIGLFWIVAIAAWLVGDDRTLPAYLERWNHWDARVFTQIAEYGYSGPPGEPGQFNAFFPGVPLLERAVHVVVPSWVASALILSFVAGAVAVVALVRLVGDVLGTAEGEEVGRRAAWALCLSPLTVFLTAGYSEPVFLAFALPAWLNARRGRWPAAAALAAGACTTRINGLFLVAALAVQLARQWLGAHRFASASRTSAPLAGLWLVAATAPVVTFFAYLHTRTGRWDAYFQAQADGWGRRYIGVLDTFHLVWAGAADPADHAGWSFGYRLDLAAMLLALGLLGWLVARRRWAAACYVAAAVASLAAMSTYTPASRTTLLLWPLWLAAGLVSYRRRFGKALTALYVAVCVPLAVLLAAAFSLWHWAG